MCVRRHAVLDWLCEWDKMNETVDRVSFEFIKNQPTHYRLQTNYFTFKQRIAKLNTDVSFRKYCFKVLKLHSGNCIIELEEEKIFFVALSKQLSW